MLLSIRHTTRYAYPEPADYSIQCLRLTPSLFGGQQVNNWTVRVPGATLIEIGPDGFGNFVHQATLNEPHSELLIEAFGEVETEDRNGIVAGLPEPAVPAVFLRTTKQTAPGTEIEKIVEEISSEDAIARLHDLMHIIESRLEYEVGSTHAHTSAMEALIDGKGVCQDFAHIFIASARLMGLPARYVTGYLLLEGELEDPSAAHHAWAEAHVSGLGWVGFDVANGCCPTDRYVRLAGGLDARSAAPIRGTRHGGSEEALDVNVVVQQNSRQQQQQQ